jgi:hypothetical protein
MGLFSRTYKDSCKPLTGFEAVVYRKGKPFAAFAVGVDTVLLSAGLAWNVSMYYLKTTCPYPHPEIVRPVTGTIPTSFSNITGLVATNASNVAAASNQLFCSGWVPIHYTLTAGFLSLIVAAIALYPANYFKCAADNMMFRWFYPPEDARSLAEKQRRETTPSAHPRK